MAVLNVQVIDRAGDGLDPQFAAASAGGDEFANNGTAYVEVVNGGGSPVTVTVATPQTQAGLAVADLTVAIPAGGRRKFGSFPPATFNNSANGRVALTYSGVTSVTVGVFRLS